LSFGTWCVFHCGQITLFPEQIIQIVKHRPRKGSALKMFLSHFTRDTIPVQGINGARTLWSDSTVSDKANIQDLSQQYDSKVASMYDQLWSEIMVPKLDQMYPLGAPVQWWDNNIIACSRQILWMLGDRLVAQFGPVYEDLSNSLHVYAALPLASQDAHSGIGGHTAVFWPQAQLPSAVVSRSILHRYQWMTNDIISSMVGSYVAVDNLVHSSLLFLDWPLNVSELPAVAYLSCVSAICWVGHPIGGHTCLGLPLLVAGICGTAFDVLLVEGRFHDFTGLSRCVNSHVLSSRRLSSLNQRRFMRHTCNLNS
jgi:hypothetical protein